MNNINSASRKHSYRVNGLVTTLYLESRHNIVGGETQIIDPMDDSNILFSCTLGENEAIVIQDEAFLHHATNFKVGVGVSGYRDIWVVEIDYWEDRCYGPLHEQKASA